MGEEGAGGRWGAGMDMALGEESSQGNNYRKESRWAWNHDGTAALPHWNRPGDCEKRGGDERDGFVQSPPGLLIGGQFSLLLLCLLPLASSMSCPFAFSGASCDASARDLPSIVHCLKAAVWILIQQTQRPVQPSGQEVSMVKLFGETPCPTPLTGERATPPSRRPHHHATPTVTHQRQFSPLAFSRPPSDSLPSRRLRPATTSSSLVWLPTSPATSRLQAIAA